MTVLLVIAMFAVFLTVDYVLSRRRAAAEVPDAETTPVFHFEHQPVPVATTYAPDPVPVWVAGYQLPSDLQYHRGHTWVRPLDNETAVVGLDDFASRLLGRADSVSLPEVGDRVRQGARVATVAVPGRTRRTSLVSPLDGEVLETNAQLTTKPDLVTQEPYGRGWLYKVRSRELVDNLRNLFSGSLARRWTQDARERLELDLMALSGTVMQDGGEPVENFGAYLEDEDWERLTGEFLLT